MIARIGAEAWRLVSRRRSPTSGTIRLQAGRRRCARWTRRIRSGAFRSSGSRIGWSSSRGDYHWQHEACWYAGVNGKPATMRDRRTRTQTTVWTIRPARTTAQRHGTQKPVGLHATRACENHTLARRVRAVSRQRVTRSSPANNSPAAAAPSRSSRRMCRSRSTAGKRSPASAREGRRGNTSHGNTWPPNKPPPQPPKAPQAAQPPARRGRRQGRRASSRRLTCGSRARPTGRSPRSSACR